MSVEDASGESTTGHRGSGGAKPASTFETRCYERVLGREQQRQSSALFLDAELVDSPKEAKTFWLPADACPTTSLELLAKAIFDFHTENRDGEATDSCTEPGAEWWVQRREEGHHANLGMPFHWDKDEHMLDQKGVVLCPAVSTVTYLTDHGAPTVVLESRVSERGAVEHGDIKRAFVSYPALFKHLAFDGGFLHGVPEQLMRTEDKREGHRASNGQLEEGGTRNQVRSCAAVSPSASSGRQQRGRMRVTLLVNVWLSHKPEGVAPLPADLAATLSSGGVIASPLLCFDRPIPFIPVSIEKENEALARRPEKADGATMVINAPLGPTLVLELQAPTPRRLSAGRLKALHSFALVFREESLSRISTGHGGEAGGCSEGSMDEDGAERRGRGLVEGHVGREVDRAAERISRKRKS